MSERAVIAPLGQERNAQRFWLSSGTFFCPGFGALQRKAKFEIALAGIIVQFEIRNVIPKTMHAVIDTNDALAVGVEVQSIYLSMFPEGDRFFVARALGWTIDWFTGKFHDYQPMDTRYHDFEHTLQGTLCMARLLQGRHAAKAEPVMTKKAFELGVLAMLLHDIGYLKMWSDTTGTGAKYTRIHVARSTHFAEEMLLEKKFAKPDIAAIQHMIRCTGVNSDVSSIPFEDPLQRIVGLALGTSDLLGQMSADDYVEKLPVLYEELAESALYEGKAHPGNLYSSAEDLVRKTPAFWENYVFPKIKLNYEGMYRFLNNPYPDGPNEYLQRIEANLRPLRSRFPVDQSATQTSRG